MVSKISSLCFCIVMCSASAQEQPEPEFSSRTVLELGVPPKKVMKFFEPNQRCPLPATVEMSPQGFTYFHSLQQ